MTNKEWYEARVQMCEEHGLYYRSMLGDIRDVEATPIRTEGPNTLMQVVFAIMHPTQEGVMHPCFPYEMVTEFWVKPHTEEVEYADA